MKPTYPKARLALGRIFLVALCGSSEWALAADLKTINFEESYVVDGQSVSLRQNLGEVVVKLDPASADTVTEIRTTANGTYAESRNLDKQSALFSALPPVQPTAESSQSVIDDLNTDSRVLQTTLNNHVRGRFLLPTTQKWGECRGEGISKERDKSMERAPLPARASQGEGARTSALVGESSCAPLKRGLNASSCFC